MCVIAFCRCAAGGRNSPSFLLEAGGVEADEATKKPKKKKKAGFRRESQGMVEVKIFEKG